MAQQRVMSADQKSEKQNRLIGVAIPVGALRSEKSVGVGEFADLVEFDGGGVGGDGEVFAAAGGGRGCGGRVKGLKNKSYKGRVKVKKSKRIKGGHVM